MFPLAVALLIVGYGITYWGALNFKSGGKGPGFGEVFGLSDSLPAEEELNSVGGIGKLTSNDTPNLTGQPPTTAESPSGGVWT